MPLTVALHCAVAFASIVEGVQASEMDEIVEPEWLAPLPPQAVSATRTKDIPKA